MTYPRDERETVTVYEAATRTWSIYTCEPRHRRRLEKLYGPPDWTDAEPNGGARWLNLPSRAVGFRQKVATKRVLKPGAKTASTPTTTPSS